MTAAPFAELKRTLYTAVLSDVLDGLGRMDRAMRPFVRPLDDASGMMGRARTGVRCRHTPMRSSEHVFVVDRHPSSESRPVV